MAPAALSKLEQNRQALKDTLDYLEQELADDKTTPLDEVSASFLMGMVKTAAVDNAINHKAILECNPPNLADHQTAYHAICKKIRQQTSALAGINARFVPATPTPTTTSTNHDIRLPKLELPTFDGNLQQWVSFHDLFTNAIHNKSSISKAEKLTYLKSLLRGDASRLINTLVVTDANYDLAWQKLIDRYQNERELVFAVFKRFNSQKNIQQATPHAVRELIDVSLECVRSLEVFSITLDKGLDAFLMYLLFCKLDDATRQLWEQQLTDTKLPSFQALVDFLEQRARALSASGCSSNRTYTHGGQKQLFQGNQPRQQANTSTHHTATSSSSSKQCQVCCKPFHALYKCASFHALSLLARQDIARKSNLCTNCLSTGHGQQDCPSTGKCRDCNGRHHTLLHRPRQQTATSGSTAAAANTTHTSESPSVNYHTSSQKASERFEPGIPCDFPSSLQVPGVPHQNTVSKKKPLLGTAIVLLTDRHGRLQQCRALLDSCAEDHYMTEECTRRLGLQQRRVNVPINGLGEHSVGTAKSLAWSSVASRFEPLKIRPAQFLIVKSINSKVPSSFFDANYCPHLSGLQLADPFYFRPSKVDILLGSDIYYATLGTEKTSGNPNDPIATKFDFGWVIGGGRGFSDLPSTALLTSLKNPLSTMDHSLSIQDERLDLLLQKFWELEAVPVAKLLTEEEELCESHFASTTRRQEDGRFIVSLPRKVPTPILGNSLQTAIRRLQQVERRLQKNSSHLQDYVKFMQEYEAMGHMVEVSSPADDNHTIFIPHHFVLKESSTTTKFRVVFDASAKTSTGVSVNDTLLVGPTIQDSLADLIMRFRTHRIALTGDIAKMYRQIVIDSNETHLQHIVWRDDPNKPLKFYKLLTVTYGTAPAPFIATRVLKEVAVQNKDRFPKVSEILQNDFYVDDLMTGTTTVEEAIKLRPQLQTLCDSAKLPLRKWTSSSQEVLESIPSEFRETQSLFSMDNDPTVKALGIFWNAQEDCFIFKTTLTICKSAPCNLTKRMLSSAIAKLFDPIGWLAPVTIRAKILMQKTWALGCSWDTVLPNDIQTSWMEMVNDFKQLELLRIPRYYASHQLIHSSTTKLCLIGFSDASEDAYSACVYLGIYPDVGTPVINLITAKTRVAPCKRISVPRLELCGALLLAELMPSVTKALKLPLHSISAWSDSTVTLDWIYGHPSKRETFIANRVTKIQNLIASNNWGHVSGVDNPADCASRGISAADLINHPLWWHGPAWLLDGMPNPQYSPTSLSKSFEEKDEKILVPNQIHQKGVPSSLILLTQSSSSDSHFMERFSDVHRLTRVTARLIQFSQKCRPSKYPTDASQEDLSNLNSLAVQSLVKWTQSLHFHDEILCLRNGKGLSSKSSILSLSPFLDPNGVLRVGGRLCNSSLTPDKKNPMLLPSNNHLTYLIIRAAHLDNFHAGPQLVQSVLYQQYWILRGRDVIRHQIKKCVICTRHAARTQEQYMGNLPASRVNPCRPFQKCGVDYAGPFLIKPNLPRSKTTLKCYLSVFVCFVTRAIHLEIVSDLSTSAFQGALKRFVSRRGRPSEIHSDNGTNFVGAARELKEWLSITRSEDFNVKVSNQCNKQGILWKFIPPGAPHFGGIWESGVKSVKFHLQRILGSHRLTYEELSTVTIQIEAILNSRPLTAASSDPNDLTVLTPGHFLIGAPLTAVPEPDLTSSNINHLDRWQLLQQIQQHFWKRWSSEFLTRLQQRPKWASARSDLKINDLVLIKNELLPPQQWKLGRITVLHPGTDSIARVATIKTAYGEIKRPFVKLCLLPYDK